jgi:flagellar biosynthesis/type III secretory pathway protein FliH
MEGGAGMSSIQENRAEQEAADAEAQAEIDREARQAGELLFYLLEAQGERERQWMAFQFSAPGSRDVITALRAYIAALEDEAKKAQAMYDALPREFKE